MNSTDSEIILGLDVGETDRWAWAVTKDGNKIWNKIRPIDEAELTRSTKTSLLKEQFWRYRISRLTVWARPIMVTLDEHRVIVVGADAKN